MKNEAEKSTWVLVTTDGKIQDFSFTQDEADEFLTNLNIRKFILISEGFYVNTAAIQSFSKQ